MTSIIEPSLHPDASAHSRRAADVRTEPDLLPPADDGVPIADPAPLGLAAFAGTTFVLSLFNAGLVGNVALVAVVLRSGLPGRWWWGGGRWEPARGAFGRPAEVEPKPHARGLYTG